MREKKADTRTPNGVQQTPEREDGLAPRMCLANFRKVSLAVYVQPRFGVAWVVHLTDRRLHRRLFNLNPFRILDQDEKIASWRMADSH